MDKKGTNVMPILNATPFSTFSYGTCLLVGHMHESRMQSIHLLNIYYEPGTMLDVEDRKRWDSVLVHNKFSIWGKCKARREEESHREKLKQHIAQGNYLSVLHGAGIMKVLIKTTANTYITFNMCQVTILSHFHILIHLIFTTTLWSRYTIIRPP